MVTLGITFNLEVESLDDQEAKEALRHYAEDVCVPAATKALREISGVTPDFVTSVKVYTVEVHEASPTGS